MNTRIFCRLSRGWLPVAIAAAFFLMPVTVSAGKPPPTTRPLPPSNLAATAVSTSQINLAWTDNSSNETGFKIVRTNPDSTTKTITTGANVAYYSDTGLSASSTYSYRVWSTNAGGNSTSYAGPASATTQAKLTFVAVDIGSDGQVTSINDSGMIVGTAGGTAFVIEPTDVNGDGKLEWFKSDGNGGNALMKPLPKLTQLGLGGTQACAINASGQIVGWQSYKAVGTDDHEYYEGEWDYEAAVLWVRNADGTYGEPVELAKCSTALGINDAGYVVGYTYHPYVYYQYPGDTGWWEAEALVPFIIRPLDKNGDGKPDCWFENDPSANDGYGGNALMFKMAARPYPFAGREAVAVTDDNSVIVSNNAAIVYPDSSLSKPWNPWFKDTNGDGVNDLLVNFPVSAYAYAPSPNGRLAAGANALADITTNPPTLYRNLGMLPRSDGTLAYGVNDAAWVVGDSCTVGNWPGTHLHSYTYTGFFWKDGQMSVFSTLLSNAVVSAPRPKVINNSGIVAGTATAGGLPTMFVAFPSVSP